MPRREEDTRVPIQVFVSPETRHLFRLALLEKQMTYGDFFIPKIEGFIDENRSIDKKEIDEGKVNTIL